MVVVADASPLIYIARLDIFELVIGEFERIEVPNAVHREAVIAGLAHGYDDAKRIEAAMESEGLAMIDLDVATTDFATDLAAMPQLGMGESETIARARQRGFTALLEDRRARRVARELRVETIGCLDVLYRSLLLGRLDHQEMTRLVHGYARLTHMDAATLIAHESQIEQIHSSVGPRRKGGKE